MVHFKAAPASAVTPIASAGQRAGEGSAEYRGCGDAESGVLPLAPLQVLPPHG